MTPLNPQLYALLQRRFGDVRIASPGVSAAIDPASLGRGRIKFMRRGETYKVNCPFCYRRGAPDYRHRLYVHHRWGYGFPELNLNDRLWWAVKCFNNECMKIEAYRKQLQFEVYEATGGSAIRQAVAIPFSAADDTGPVEVELPGRCIPLHELPSSHYANVFLVGRGFDPTYLSRVYGISYCDRVEDFRYNRAIGRIIIPWHLDGKLIGWQARYIGTPPNKRVPKYYNCPGAQKRYYLYGYEQARDFAGCFIVEGVTDVWAMGPGALAVMGSSISYEQAEMVCRNWECAVILLDGGEVAAAEAIQQQLSTIPTEIVSLPDGQDPCDMKQELPDYLVGELANRNPDILNKVFKRVQRLSGAERQRATRHCYRK